MKYIENLNLVPTKGKPNHEELCTLLSEWLEWANTYYEFIGPHRPLVSIMNQTTDMLARYSLRQTQVRGE